MIGTRHKDRSGSRERDPGAVADEHGSDQIGRSLHEDLIAAGAIAIFFQGAERERALAGRRRVGSD